MVMDQAERNKVVIADLKNFFEPIALNLESSTDAINVHADDILEAFELSIGSATKETEEKIEQLSAYVTEAVSAIKDENADLKTQYSGLINFIRENGDFILAAALAKNIPVIEQRVKFLEEEFDRVRNWGLNKWVLVFGIVSVLFACVATLVAIGAWIFPR